ncbi:MAG: hypothetical protein WCS94_18595, partial [Verrucomicrobiota bacterium]
LPRGRTYVRNGSVVDLQISKGSLTALVSGSSLYKIVIKIKPLAPALWISIQNECSGKIDSLIELLQGKLSASVMQIVTRRELGLFPKPGEIDMDCSCPDWADMCKHLAATLYGVGARLDQNPALLFLLRGVDPAELISKASAAEAVSQKQPSGATPAMSDSELADVFGIELDSTPPAPTTAAEVAATLPTSSPASSTPAPKHNRKGTQKNVRKISAAARAKIAAAARVRWARIKKQQTYSASQAKPAKAKKTASKKSAKT